MRRDVKLLYDIMPDTINLQLAKIHVRSTYCARTRLWTQSARRFAPRFAPRFALNKWIEAFDLHTFLWCSLTIKLVKTGQLWRLVHRPLDTSAQLLPFVTGFTNLDSRALFSRAFTKILRLLTVLLAPLGGTPDLNRSDRDDRLGAKISQTNL